MADRYFSELKAQAKLADAQGKAALAAAEVEKAKANAEKTRGETERARMKEERETRLATEASARKTREEDAKFAAEKRAAENTHLIGSIAGGLTAGKVTAKLIQKAADKRMTALQPQIKILAKEAAKALKGTGARAHQTLKGIASTAPSAHGPLGLGVATLFAGDAALGFYQANKMRAQGDEDAARNLETFARGNLIAGVLTPLLRWDQEKSANKFPDLKSQATLKTAKLAADGPAGPEPKRLRTTPKPALAAPTANQKAIAAPDMTPPPQGEPRLALPSPKKAKPAAGPAKAAGPTLDEMRAAAKAAAPTNPKMKGFYKLDKQNLKILLRDNKIKLPGHLKYGIGLGVATTLASSMMGAARSEASTLSGKIADAGTALDQDKGEIAKDLAIAGGATFAMARGQRLAERAAANILAKRAAASIAGRAGGTLTARAAKSIAQKVGARVVTGVIPGLGVAANAYTAYEIGKAGYDYVKTIPQRERMANFKRGEGYRLTPTAEGEGGEARSALKDNVAAGRIVRERQARQHATGYYARRGGKMVWNKFSPATLAARRQAR